jgi:multicomponent K+:H+ antiporter subunit E
MKLSSPTGWLPMPAQSLILFVVWLLLNNTLAPGHILLGAVLALTIPLLIAPTQAPQPRVVRHWAAVRYVGRVLWDILVANFEVAMRVLGPTRRLQPAFVAIPLDVEGALPITILASTISLTPGTVSAEVSEDRKWLYIHALHLEDEAALIAQIKSRYEAPIKEIFGC